MHRYSLLSIDLACVCMATLLALLLRDNLEFSISRSVAVIPYLVFSLVSAAIVFPLVGTHRVVWRYGTFHDFLRVPAAVACTVLGAVSLGFAFSRLEGVARALPPLQAILLGALMVAVRVAHKWRHAERVIRPRAYVIDEPRETLLIVGVNAVTDSLLRAIAASKSERIYVAGLVGRGGRGRVFQKQAILGSPEEISRVIKELEAHGVFVDRVIVTERASQLSVEARSKLAGIEAGSDIAIEYIPECIEGAQFQRALPLRLPTSNAARAGRSQDDDLGALVRSAALNRPYWAFKRTFDAAAAAVLIILLAPVIALVTLTVYFDVGHPLLFWQLRPGALRRPFKLHKFRTMRAAHDHDGNSVADALRTSPLGRLLRRTHLDELPQLFHILTGEMSFIGPRPLLAVDQAREHAARLAIRPGLSGWAQVNGGRHLSASDKAAMDIWYVHNASFSVDALVITRTLRTLLFGERPNAAAVREAWRFLRASDYARDAGDLSPQARRWVA